MTKVENLEKLVQQLSPEELAEFRRWYAEFDDEVRGAYEAVAYSEWLAAEIQEAVEDPRANYSHDQVMSGLRADVDALKTNAAEVALKRQT